MNRHVRQLRMTQSLEPSLTQLTHRPLGEKSMFIVMCTEFLEAYCIFVFVIDA